MLVALGESYEKLNSMQQAKKVSSISYNPNLARRFRILSHQMNRFKVKYGWSVSSDVRLYFQCYFRAISVGDMEGIAVIKLAR